MCQAAFSSSLQGARCGIYLFAFFSRKGEIINVLTCDPGDLVNQLFYVLETCINVRLFARHFEQEQQAHVWLKWGREKKRKTKSIKIA